MSEELLMRIQEMAARIKELERENAELRKDSARYKLLRDAQGDWQICYWSDEFDAWENVQANELKNIDAAIDEAMKHTEEQISKWARESNMSTPLYDYQKEQLQAFATIVRRHTLEEAAKVTESFSEECSPELTHADAIRSLKS